MVVHIILPGITQVFANIVLVMRAYISFISNHDRWAKNVITFSELGTAEYAIHIEYISQMKYLGRVLN